MPKPKVKTEVVKRGGRFCGHCNRPVNEHPYVGAKSRKETRFCDLVPVIDITNKDGEIVTKQAPDDVVQRTKKNNLRLVHASILVR